MKYIIALFAIITFTSCKKEYLCRCLNKDGHEVHRNNFKSTKNEVEIFRQRCIGLKVSYEAEYPLQAPITCTLN